MDSGVMLGSLVILIAPVVGSFLGIALAACGLTIIFATSTGDSDND